MSNESFDRLDGLSDNGAMGDAGGVVDGTGGGAGGGDAPGSDGGADGAAEGGAKKKRSRRGGRGKKKAVKKGAEGLAAEDAAGEAGEERAEAAGEVADGLAAESGDEPGDEPGVGVVGAPAEDDRAELGGALGGGASGGGAFGGGASVARPRARVRGGRRVGTVRAEAEDAGSGRDEVPAPAAVDERDEGESEAAGAAPISAVVRKPAAIKGPRVVGPKVVGPKLALKPGASAGAVAAESAAQRVDMVVNYVPGEECRIAVVEDGQLEEFYSEPTGQVSRVGNIYVGRVTNIETAIQAAFVDFGLEESAFLHVSDLHPKYFRDEDEGTEELGKKTPRKQRPPIQACLRKGQEIVVQVLKEGVGTKGPSVTTYLSIPGRFLVMMPDMEKFGVSRKEEDDDKRREAKEILSQLELPDGFGFILRTAGFGRTKTELKRDLAYLQRLWKDMEARRGKGSKPRLLYSESDLLIRSLRDLLGNDVQRVIVDDEQAVARAARFMKIVAPRTQAQLVHYKGALPIYHAFDVERQVQQIHAREVPLPSGGRLIIEQTEALVAIDVNSGKSRGAKDAETNAYQTNVEAVDSICRQLRLRDLGGLVINDLIDMRLLSHRKDIEQRFRERLKRDRARTTTLQISEFGILEMTRQRMRGSQESQHFSECPICRGRGIVQKADSVAADALRDMAALLDHDRVHRVELAVHPRIAGALLTTRRASLTRAELSSGKRIDVRVSDAVPPDRVALYGYDGNDADIDLERLPRGRAKPVLEVVDLGVPARAAREEAEDAWAVDAQAEAAEASKKRLMEQLEAAKRAAGPTVDELPDLSDLDEEDGDEGPLGGGAAGEGEGGEGGGKRKRRKRRRRGRGGADGGDAGADAGGEARVQARTEMGPAGASDGGDENAEGDDEGDEDGEGGSGEGGEVVLGPDGQPLKKKRRRRRGGRRRRKNREDGSVEGGGEGGGEGVRESGTEDDGAEGERAQPQPSARPEIRARPTLAPRGGASRPAAPARAVGREVGRAALPERAAVEPVAPEPEKPVRRALYGVGRRKLAPSEVSKIKGKKDAR